MFASQLVCESASNLSISQSRISLIAGWSIIVRMNSINIICVNEIYSH